MDLAEFQSDAAAIIAATESQFIAPQTIVEGGVPFSVVPDGMKVQEMEGFLPAPIRKKISLSFFDPESLANYVAAQSEDRTAIFASVSSAEIRAVIDYHDKEPRWGSHVAILKCSLSDDWKEWSGIDNKPLTQTQFAEFLEEHTHNVVQPESAKILEIARNLQITQTVNFKSKVNLQNGLVQFAYSEEESGSTAQMTVPEFLTLGIAPFESSAPFEVKARLRYRLKDQKLSFTVILDRPKKVVEFAFRQVVQEVEKKTSILPFLTA